MSHADLTTSEHEIARAQYASLLALRAVTALVSNNGTLSSLFSADYTDPENASYDDDALQWIKRNALSYGQRFDEASLPMPTIEHHITKKHTSQHAGNVTGQSVHVDNTALHSSQDQLNHENVISSREKGSLDRSDQHDIPPNKALTNSKQPPDDSGIMNDIAPPEPEEQAEFDNKTKQLVDSETPKRPARTVHLPPENVQEERLSHRLEEARRPTSSSNADKVHKFNQAEAASSPSSTVGAYSAATPMPPQDSPDTSPDSETAEANIPAEFRPSPTERRAKEEHDRLLEAQKAIAHQAALGDITTPDDQLRWEEREAASRDAEEKSAAEERKRQQMQQSSLRETAYHNEKDDTAKTSAQDAASAPEPESQEDTIAVKAPARPKTDSARPISSGSTFSIPVNRSHLPETARRGSEAVSIITSRRRSSLEAVSPVLSRRKLSTPKRPTFDRSEGEELDQRDMLHDLDTLKGAAQDPDRDYLEPLFKIQAHDSPNINSSALPELVRGAYKTISTEDQFTAIHERMEYRILRRIYHLQNANKWSLRQMEKAKEPPQPVSHHDHMMAEMKWMCKDFRAERKRKKSVCAWLAQRCAEWVAADAEERLQLQVRVKAREEEEISDVPELDEDGDSPVNDAAMPATPPEHDTFITRLIVDPELLDNVRELQQKGALTRALKQVPIWQPPELETAIVPPQSMTRVSKFVGGKVVPHIPHPIRKRSRYDYESESDEDSDDRPVKRSREERALPPEGPDVAVFHPDNKPIRDRLHAQNAFRPPSEFPMPSVSFYEFRNGSQWISEDDQKLRKLARDHSFNWSIIADQMQLPSRFKSGMERRTPWECFERWVELEQMPAEMRKTVYFKTWYSRLDQSSQAVDRRYQAQVAQANAQNAQGNTPVHTPTRRRTTPMRVEKRKNTRYLWTVDAMRKNAKKRELSAYKQAEATRAAAQRKASQQNDNPQPRRSMPTPQELSQKRYERDLQMAEAHRVHRQKLLEAQRQAQMARAAQAGLTNGTAAQRQAGAQNGTQQAQAVAAAQLNNANAQLTPQQRQALQIAAQSGQLNAAQTNGQNVPQAQMQATPQNAAQQNLQRLTAQVAARNMQLTPQQQQLVLQSNGLAGKNWQSLTAAQQAALIAAYTQNQQRNANGAAATQASQQASASPSMPPPPAPANTSQQLSSGHVPALFAIKNMYRAKHPQLTEEQLNHLSTEYLKSQQLNQSRQNAVNAAAGNNNVSSQATPTMANYGQNQAQFQNNTNGNTAFNADGTQVNGTNGMANDTRNYKMLMHQRQMAQLRLGQGSPQTGHAIPNGSPNMHHASPNMAPVSPNVQFANQRPPSRSATPQMQRLGSSGSVPGVAVSGMQSPGAVNMQGSPQNMHANMAR